MAFNVEAARKAGYSDDEILQHLTQTRKYNVDAAVKAGYQKPEIIKYLSSTSAPSTQAPKPQGAMASLGTGALNIGKDLIGMDQNKSQGFIPTLVQSTVGSKGLAGVAQLPGRVASAVSEYGLLGIGGSHQGEKLQANADELDKKSLELSMQSRQEADPVKRQHLHEAAIEYANNARAIREGAAGVAEHTNTTGGQALGTAANAALTAVTASPGGANLLGKVSPALKTLEKGSSFISKGAKALYYTGRVAENAGLGLAYNTANNLTEGKDVGEGAGVASLVGGLVPLAGRAASGLSSKVGKSIGATAEGLTNSYIKPLQRHFAYGKNPAQGVLREGITGGSLEEVGQKVFQKAQEVGQQIGTVGKTLTDSGVKMDLTKALAPIDAAMNTAAKANRESVFNSLAKVKEALLHEYHAGVDEAGKATIVKGAARDLANSGYNDAVQFLDNISEHARFTGNPSDDEAINKAVKSVYGRAREIMNNTASKVDKGLGNQIRDLNTRYSDLLSAKNAIKNRDLVTKRQNIVNLADKLSIGAAVIYAVASGDYKKAGIALAAELVGSKIGGSVRVKSNVAKFLNALAPSEREGILSKTPALKEYWERITGTPAKREKTSINIPQPQPEPFKPAGLLPAGGSSQGETMQLPDRFSNSIDHTTKATPVDEYLKSIGL